MDKDTMIIKWYEGKDPRPTTEPMMALIAHDGTHAYVSTLDDGFEHYILLKKMTGSNDNLDNYFRIIFNSAGADWTFVCPSGYKGITNKEYRIKTFYDDGYTEIKNFLKLLGYPEVVEIPTRYRRHLDYLTNDNY